MSRNLYSTLFSVGRVKISIGYLQGSTSMVGPSVPQWASKSSSYSVVPFQPRFFWEWKAEDRLFLPV